MHCPVPGAQSLHAYRPLCNSPDKTLYDVTLARRFWRGKQMIVCEQTRFRTFLLVGCSTKVSLDQTVLRSACIKKVPTSQRAVTLDVVRSGEFRVGGGRGKTKKGALWWRHHNQPTVIITFDLPKIQLPKDMFLRLRQNWNSRRKCKRVFMIHNFESTESWEDMAKSRQ